MRRAKIIGWLATPATAAILATFGACADDDAATACTGSDCGTALDGSPEVSTPPDARPDAPSTSDESGVVGDANTTPDTRAADTGVAPIDAPADAPADEGPVDTSSPMSDVADVITTDVVDASSADAPDALPDAPADGGDAADAFDPDAPPVTAGLIGHYLAAQATPTNWPGRRGPTLAIVGTGADPTQSNIGGVDFVCFTSEKYYGLATTVFDNAERTLIAQFRRSQSAAWQWIAGKDTYNWDDGYGLEMNNDQFGGYSYRPSAGPPTRVAITADTNYGGMLIDTASAFDVFLNGSAVGTSTAKAGTTNSALYPFTIGKVPTNDVWGLRGCVSEVLYYDRAVTPTERADLDTWLAGRR